MTVILDQYPLLQTGTFEIRQTVTVHVTAEEAWRKVALVAHGGEPHVGG
ncbi:MAG: hypothetical protein R3E79_25325 [Caldilineaceae bacterium]